MTVRDLFVRFGADSSGFSAGAAQVKKELEGLNTNFYKNKAELSELNKDYRKAQKEMKELALAMKDGKATDEQRAKYKELEDQVNKLTPKIAQLSTVQQDLKSKIKLSTSELDKHNAEMKQTPDAADKSAKSIGNLAKAVKVLVAGYTGKKLYEWLIEGNAQMEQYLTSFDVMLGGADKAKTLMQDLQKFTAVTPFGLTDSTNAAQLLLNYGVAADEVIDKMTQLGDLSLGNVDKFGRISMAYGQMLAKNKVTGEELRQMTEAGVPLLQALADSIGVSTAELQKMISAGTVGIPQLNTAIEGLTTGTGKYAGMMEKQSQTMSGMMATINDEFAQLGRDIGEGAFDTLKGTIGELLTMIRTARDDGTLDALSKDIGAGINATVNILVGAIKIGWEYRDVIIATTAALAAYKVSMAVITQIQAYNAAIKAVRATTDAATASQTALNAATAANPWMLLATAIGAVVGAISYFVLTADDATSKLDEMAESMEAVKQQSQDMISTSEAEISMIEEKAAIYERLRSKVELTADEKKLLAGVAQELQALMPNTISLIDSETGAYLSLAGAIDQVIAQKRAEMNLKATEKVYWEAYDQHDALGKQMKDAEAEIQKLLRENGWHTVTEAEDAFLYDDNSGAMWNDWFHEDYYRIKELEKQISDAAAMRKDLNAEMEEYFDEYEKYMSDYGSPTGTDTGGGGGIADTMVNEFSDAYEELKFRRDMDIISQGEYYNQLEGLLKNNNAAGLAEYNRYYVEVYSGRKKLNEQLTAEQEKAGKEAQAALQAEFTAQYDTLKRSHSRGEMSSEEYYSALLALLRAFAADGKSEYQKYYDELYNLQQSFQASTKAALKDELNDWVSAEREKADEIYNQRKEGIENSYNQQKDALEAQLDAQKKATTAKIKLLEKEAQAEKERINELIKNIDKEIQARRRQKEETDTQAEIDAINARLKYEQIDELTRRELEKERNRLIADKDDRDWERSKESEKEALRAKIDAIDAETKVKKEQYEAEMEAANAVAETRLQAIEQTKDTMLAALEEEKKQTKEVYDFISENFTSLAELQMAGITDLDTAFRYVAENTKAAANEHFSLLEAKTIELADVYASQMQSAVASVSIALQDAIAQAKMAASEVQNATTSANAAASLLQSTVKNVTNKNSININNPALSSGQLIARMLEAMGTVE